MNKVCPNCGNIVKESDKFCNECGYSTQEMLQDSEYMDSEVIDEQIQEEPPYPEFTGRMAQKHTEKSNNKKIVLIIIIAIIVVAGGIFSYLYFFNGSDEPKPEQAPPVTETTPAAIEEKPAQKDTSDEKVNKEILSDIGLSLNQIGTVYGEIIWNEYWFGGLGYVFESGHGMYFFDQYNECYGIEGVKPSDLFIGLPGESSPTELAEEYGLTYMETNYSEMDDTFVSVFSYDKYSMKITTEQEGVITIDSSIFLANEKFAAMQRGEVE